MDSAPAAPQSMLQEHTLPPHDWGSPPSSSFSRIQQMAHKITATIVSCEGFLMQKVSVQKSSTCMLTWQQRYMLLNPDNLTLTWWEIAPGQVVVSRPTTPGTTMSVSAIASVNSWVGKNKTRFDVIMHGTTSGTGTGTLLSLMADTPEDCSRWVSALNMAVAAVRANKSVADVEPAANGDGDGDGNTLFSSNIGRSTTADDLSPWKEVTHSVSMAMEKDPSLRGTILYGLPAFFSAIDRDGMGLVSLHEFEQGMLRLGLHLSRASIDDLNITSGTGRNALVAYREVVGQLKRVALSEDDQAPRLSAASSPSASSRSKSKQVLGRRNGKPRASPMSEAIVNPTTRSAAATSLSSSRTITKRSAKSNSPAKQSPGKKAQRSSANSSSRRRAKRAGRDKLVSGPPKVLRQNKNKNKNKSSLLGSRNRLIRSSSSSQRGSAKYQKEQIHYIPVPAATTNTEEYNQAMENRHSNNNNNNNNSNNSSVMSNPSTSAVLAGRTKKNSSKNRTTSYARPWAKQLKKSKSNSNALNSLVDLNRVQVLSVQNRGNIVTASSASKVEADRKEKHALHSALTSAQQMIAQETRNRQKAEKQLSREKKKEAEAVRKMLSEQAQRDESNANNLDKLHVMYGKQVDKLRTMLDAEGNQLADAREEIAEMTLKLQLAATNGVDVGFMNHSISKRNTAGSSTSSSTKAALQGAADLILLERLASVEEELANATDHVAGLEEENRVLRQQMSASASNEDVAKTAAARADMLVNELRRALELSKEESKILESERQRLMRENSALTRAMGKMDRMVYGKTKDTARQALDGNHPMSRSFTAGTNPTRHNGGGSGIGRGGGNGRGSGNRAALSSKRTAKQRAAAKERARLTKSFSGAPKAYRKTAAVTRKKNAVTNRMLRDPQLR